MKPKTEQEVIDFLELIISSNVRSPQWIWSKAKMLKQSITSDNTEVKVLKSNVSPSSEVEKLCQHENAEPVKGQAIWCDDCESWI